MKKLAAIGALGLVAPVLSAQGLTPPRSIESGLGRNQFRI